MSFPDLIGPECFRDRNLLASNYTTCKHVNRGLFLLKTWIIRSSRIMTDRRITIQIFLTCFSLFQRRCFFLSMTFCALDSTMSPMFVLSLNLGTLFLLSLQEVTNSHSQQRMDFIRCNFTQGFQNKISLVHQRMGNL